MNLFEITNLDLIEMNLDTVMHVTACIAAKEDTPTEKELVRLVESRRIGEHIRVDLKLEPSIEESRSWGDSNSEEWGKSFYAFLDESDKLEINEVEIMVKDFLIEKDGKHYLDLDKHSVI